MMYPQHVSKLILLHSVPLLAEEFTEFLKQWSERTASIKGVLEKIQSSQAFLNGDIVAHEQYWKICFSKYVYRSEDVNQLDLTVDKEAIATGKEVMNIFASGYLTTFDITQSVQQRVKCPVLIVHGAEDIMPVYFAKTIHQHIPHSRLEILKECNHFGFVEKPEEFFGIMESFLVESTP